MKRYDKPEPAAGVEDVSGPPYSSESGLNRWVPATLFLAWCLNDAEEWLTMADSSRQMMRRLPKWAPIPDVLRRRGVSEAEVHRAIAIMGATVLAASITGVATRGRSALFRGAALGFGLHGYAHLLSALLARGYVSGVATALAVVIPWGHWAGHRMRAAGLASADKSALVALLGVLAVLPISHALAFITLGDRAFGEPKHGDGSDVSACEVQKCD